MGMRAAAPRGEPRVPRHNVTDDDRRRVVVTLSEEWVCPKCFGRVLLKVETMARPRAKLAGADGMLGVQDSRRVLAARLEQLKRTTERMHEVAHAEAPRTKWGTSCEACATSKGMGIWYWPGCEVHGEPWNGTGLGGWPLRDAPEGA